jgi:hypothetical protein
MRRRGYEESNMGELTKLSETSEVYLLAGGLAASIIIGGLIIVLVRNVLRRRHHEIESEFRLWRGDMGVDRDRTDRAAKQTFNLGKRWRSEDLASQILRLAFWVLALFAALGAIAAFYWRHA